MGRAIRCILLIVSIALLMSLGENYLMWGFVVSRPSLSGEVRGLDDLLGVSFVRFRADEIVLDANRRSVNLNDLVSEAKESCKKDPYLCLEAKMIVELESVGANADDIPGVSEVVARAAWQVLATHGWLPTVAGKIRKDKLNRGLAIQYRKSGRELLLLAYDTNELADDTYAYSEALFDLSAPTPTLLRQVRFFYDIAGCEGVEWPLLWPANSVVLFLLWAGMHVVRRRKRDHALRL